MHKLLLSIVLAIFMVLAVVGVKNVLMPTGGANLVATGSAPAPPIPIDN